MDAQRSIHNYGQSEAQEYRESPREFSSRESLKKFQKFRTLDIKPRRHAAKAGEGRVSSITHLTSDSKTDSKPQTGPAESQEKKIIKIKKIYVWPCDLTTHQASTRTRIRVKKYRPTLLHSCLMG